MFAVIGSDGHYAETFNGNPTGTFSPDERDAATFATWNDALILVRRLRNLFKSPEFIVVAL